MRMSLQVTKSRSKYQFRPNIDPIEGRCLVANGLLTGAAVVAFFVAFLTPDLAMGQKPRPLKRLGSQSKTNQQVLDFARSRLGTQVGDGQCTRLAEEALSYAGAKNFNVLGPTGLDADYVWGTRVATLTPESHSTAAIKPGDILQFRNVVIVTKTWYPNGSWSESSMKSPHHTAIVTGVSGSTITVLHQNNNDVRLVQSGTLNLDGLQQGTLWGYRPTKV